MPAHASELQATAVGSAQATIIEPITVRQDSELDFGVVESEAPEGGSVTVSPGAGTRYNGFVKPACNAQGDCPQPHAAQFSVMGEPGRSYGIEVPSSLTIAGIAIASSDQAEARVLEVSDITVRITSSLGFGLNGKLDEDGRDRFELGGTLQIPSSLVAARYSTIIDVMVAYH